jgi:hypothetical protein
MRVRRSAGTVAVPMVLIPAAGPDPAGLPGSSSVALRTSRPGKAVPDQTGAAASSVVSGSARGDTTFGQRGNGATNASHNAGLPGAQTLARNTSAG